MCKGRYIGCVSIFDSILKTIFPHTEMEEEEEKGGKSRQITFITHAMQVCTYVGSVFLAHI